MNNLKKGKTEGCVMDMRRVAVNAIVSDIDVAMGMEGEIMMEETGTVGEGWVGGMWCSKCRSTRIRGFKKGETTTRTKRKKVQGSVSLQRLSGNDGLLLGLQPLHFQHGVQAAVRLPIRPSSLIRPSEVLTVVYGEIQVVEGVMRGSINDVFQPVAGDHIRVVDEHGPNVHADEEGEMEMFLDGEEIGEDVVGE
jgi:hypothetical protein